VTRGIAVLEHDAASHLSRGYTTLASRLDGGATVADGTTNGRHGTSRIGRLFTLRRT
jgi:hypothetical protein